MCCAQARVVSVLVSRTNHCDFYFLYSHFLNFFIEKKMESFPSDLSQFVCSYTFSIVVRAGSLTSCPSHSPIPIVHSLYPSTFLFKMPEGGTLVACAACDAGWDAKVRV